MAEGRRAAVAPGLTGRLESVRARLARRRGLLAFGVVVPAAVATGTPGLGSGVRALRWDGLQKQEKE